MIPGKTQEKNIYQLIGNIVYDTFLSFKHKNTY